MITNADITVFNRVLSSDRREVYIPTYIQGVAWYDSHASSDSGTRLQGALLFGKGRALDHPARYACRKGNSRTSGRVNNYGREFNQEIRT